jgi:nitrate reductase NapAB chaperone NapD
MLIVAVLVGCDPCSCEPSADIKARAAELSSGFKTQAAEHHSKTIAVIESTRQEIVSQNEQIIDTLKIVEASLVDSKSVRKEDDQQSAVEPQEATRANLSQPIIPVASAPAVRSSGVTMKWDIEGNWNPSILETAKHLREDHGIVADGLTHQQMHDAHAATHEGRKVANKSQLVQFVNRGSQCPGGRCPTPRRGLFGRRR